jgi:RimJ/RimL family protein N-acetyltransferase
MLVDFSFNSEHADIVFGIPEDYNLRSQRVFEKNGFRLLMKKPLPDSVKAKEELYLAINRQEYVDWHRERGSI